MVVNNERWKELTGVDISENIKAHKEQAVKEELKHISDKELEAFMQTVSSVYFSRMEGKALALNEGDFIPNVEIIHGNYEPYEYENDLDDMMINIFNKAVRSIGA